MGFPTLPGNGGGGGGSGAGVQDSLSGSSTTLAPSVRAVNAGLLLKADLAAMNTALASKASTSALTAGLAAKLDVSSLGQPLGPVQIGFDGKIAASLLPDIAVSDYIGGPGGTANEVAMLALVGQPGDWTVRNDLGTTWLIIGSDPTQLSSWRQLSYPTAPVTSVAGKVGAVSLGKADVGLTLVDNTADLSKPISTATQAALDLKSPVGHAHTISDVSALTATLAAKADASHGHTYANVAGLQADLDSKAPISHVHATTAITGLEPRLTAIEAAIPSLASLIDVTFTATAVGTTGTFSSGGRTRLLVTLTAPTGVSSALVQLESSDGLSVFGSVDFPNGSPQWIDLPAGTVTLRFRVKSYVGTGGTLSMNAKG